MIKKKPWLGTENRVWKWKNKKLMTPLSSHQKKLWPPFQLIKKVMTHPIFYRPPVEIMNGP